MAKDLENDTLTNMEKKEILTLLRENAKNMEDIGAEWPINEEAIDEATYCLANAFANMQDALCAIDEDDFDNDWKCFACNRNNNKSIGLHKFTQRIIKLQKDLVYCLQMIKGFDILEVLKDENIEEHQLKFKIYNKE